MEDLDVTIYSKDNCPWCDKAKALLESKGVPYKELKFNIDYSREQLAEKIPFNYNKVTVPQIFFGKDHIGGYEDLREFLALADTITNVVETQKRTSDE